jgi:carboxymethylenebutenolidase
VPGPDDVALVRADPGLWIGCDGWKRVQAAVHPVNMGVISIRDGVAYSPGEELLMDSGELERVWDDHNAAEFAIKDADAAVNTMVQDPYVHAIANGAGGTGREQVRSFYADVFIPGWPDDAQMEPVNRVVGGDQLVDEMHLGFTHAKQMDWLLPGVPPSNRKVEMDIVIVAKFQDGLIAGERIYWDQASVLRQVGLLEP